MPPLAGRRAAVIGGTGFLGSHLVERLVAEGVDVLAVARTTARLCRLSAARGDCVVALADVCDPDSIVRVLRQFRPDIIHVVTEYSLGLTGLWVARRLNLPALASFHTNIPGCLPYYGFGWASGMCWDYLRWFHNRAGLTL